MYPIRTNRPLWSQTFYKNHVCDHLCNIEYKINSDIFRFSYTSSCLFPEKIEPTCINLYHLQEEKFNDDVIMLPTDFMIEINYPMNNPFTKTIHIDKDEVRISDVLKLFRESYLYVYDEEEKNSSEKIFKIKKSCMSCLENFYDEQNIDKFLIIENDDMSSCNICFDTTERTEPSEPSSSLVKIKKCKHPYHKDCLVKWFNTTRDDESGMSRKSNSCPLCRQAIIFCEHCNGSEFVEEEFKGVVPPYDPNFFTIREETDGPYGIHSFYVEELLFKGVIYDKSRNTMTLIPYEEDIEEFDLGSD